MGDGPRAQILIPARDAAAELDAVFEGLLRSEGPLFADVFVVHNGRPDASEQIVEAWQPRFAARGWSLRWTSTDGQGKQIALRHGTELAGEGPSVILDARVRIEPSTLGSIVEAVQQRFDVASGELRYPEDAPGLVGRFARAYAAAPFARSTDLKGTCIAVAAEHRTLVSTMPDDVHDDRFLIVSTPRERRGSIPGAVVHYRFPDTVRELIRQQVRWHRMNRLTDEWVRQHGDVFDPPRHETMRRPYFGEAPPALADRVVYVAVMATAKILSFAARQRRATW